MGQAELRDIKGCCGVGPGTKFVKGGVGMPWLVVGALLLYFSPPFISHVCV